MSEPALRPNWWFFAFGFMGWSYLTWSTWSTSGSLLHATFVVAGIGWVFGIAGMLWFRRRFFIRDGVLFETGWTPSLGSYMTVGVDLRKLSEVRVYVPVAAGGWMDLRDTAGNAASIPRLAWRGWRGLLRVVARYSLEGEPHMTEGTEKRLRRFGRSAHDRDS